MDERVCYKNKIMNDGDYFTKIFEDFIIDLPELLESSKIIRRNSQGNMWLIGSFLYRNLIERLYNVKLSELEEIDIDFLVEGLSEERMYIPKEWELRMTSYGNPFFVKGRYRIDLNYLFNMHSILIRNLEPRIENFLSGNPLTVQSIAYDFSEEKVIGDIGMDAIENRVVKVNYLLEAEFEAKKRGISIGELVKQKAEELGFDYVLP